MSLVNIELSKFKICNYIKLKIKIENLLILNLNASGILVLTIVFPYLGFSQFHNCLEL